MTIQSNEELAKQLIDEAMSLQSEATTQGAIPAKPKVVISESQYRTRYGNNNESTWAIAERLIQTPHMKGR